MSELLDLAKYGGREGRGMFRRATPQEVLALAYAGGHFWIISLDGSARRAKINGQPKTWKRRPSEFSIPMKYGMREYFYITHSDCERVLIEVQSKAEASNA